jgi:predicted metal-dependent phosphoesterase TrpH
MSRFDLHVHSTSSDGTVPADELPALIAGAGLGGFALTDHDTTAGHVAAEQAAEAVGVRFIPGVEISADRGKPRGTMHILGFGVRRGTAELDQVISELHAARSERAPIIVDKLNDLGIDITMDEVDAYAGCAMIGRPHIAGVLMNKGYVGSIKEGFVRYIGQGGPAYVRKDNLSKPTARSAAIHAAGGVAVLAHPIQLRYEDDADLESIVRRLMDEGLDGLEVIHSDHDDALVGQYTELADRLGLIKTGGSDYHGSTKPIDLGSRAIPAAWLDTLEDALASRAVD